MCDNLANCYPHRDRPCPLHTVLDLLHAVIHGIRLLLLVVQLINKMLLCSSTEPLFHTVLMLPLLAEQTKKEKHFADCDVLHR